MLFTALALLLAPLGQTQAFAEGAATPTTFRGAFELSLMSFPSGTVGGSQDLFATATPVIAVNGGEDFGFELGAPLRLRLIDDPPQQHAQDFGGVLRFEDWDERSDFGQLLRELRIGNEDAAVFFRAGALGVETLGAGHLVNRYNNTLNPNYHPAGARLRFFIGATRTEILASDVLASRLFAADVALDLGAAFSEDANLEGRYHAAFGLAHDEGNAGGNTPSISLLQLDLDAALYRGDAAQLFAIGGVGARLLVADPAVGASLGLATEAQLEGLQLGGKLEARKLGGSYRQGFFGPAYELARFAGVGLAEVPLADERLPDAWSGYGEFSLASGVDDPSDKATRLVFTVAAEFFNFGRVDADGAFSLVLLEETLVTSGRIVVSGVNVAPRYLFGADARYRILPSLYGLAYLGTQYFPQGRGLLARGFYAGLGAGVDFER